MAKSIGEFDKRTIIELSDDVAKKIAEKFKNVQQGVDDIMGGAMIETEAKKILNKGRLSALIDSVKNLIKNTGWSIEQALNTLGVSEDDKKNIMAALA